MCAFNKSTVMFAGALLASFFAGPAAAEVVSVGPNGFEVRETAHVAAASGKAYAALLRPARWWNSDHTYSRSAANLTLDARAGGCWCETLPEGGSVEHLLVVYVAPGKVLRMRGALGPLQGMGVDGAMTWSAKASAGGTDVTLSYVVGGYAKDGFDALSKGVDQVLAEQLERLKKIIDG